MRKLTFTALILCLLMMLFISCGKESSTPFTPEPPKPTATYTGTLTVEAVHEPYSGLCVVGYAYYVTNLNGIGARIKRVEHDLLYQDSVIFSWTRRPVAGADRIEANAPYLWYYGESYYYPGYLAGWAQARIFVKDDNGHDVTIASGPVSIYWY